MQFASTYLFRYICEIHIHKHTCAALKNYMYIIKYSWTTDRLYCGWRLKLWGVLLGYWGAKNDEHKSSFLHSGIDLFSVVDATESSFLGICHTDCNDFFHHLHSLQPASVTNEWNNSLIHCHNTGHSVFFCTKGSLMKEMDTYTKDSGLCTVFFNFSILRFAC